MGYNIIINCSGLGAGKLVNDGNIRPARGQVVFVRAPWIKHFVINDKRDKLTYVLPRTDSVVLEAQLRLETGVRLSIQTLHNSLRLDVCP